MNTNHSDEKLYYTAVPISIETSFSMRAEERDQNIPDTQKIMKKMIVRFTISRRQFLFGCLEKKTVMVPRK